MKYRYGTQRLRFGKDSMVPFGHCCLSLQPVVDPVVTPSGHLYSREVILNYLLEKTKEIRLQQAVYDSEQAKEESEKAAEQARHESAPVDRFREMEGSLRAHSSSTSLDESAPPASAEAPARAGAGGASTALVRVDKGDATSTSLVASGREYVGITGPQPPQRSDERLSDLEKEAAAKRESCVCSPLISFMLLIYWLCHSTGFVSFLLLCAQGKCDGVVDQALRGLRLAHCDGGRTEHELLGPAIRARGGAVEAAGTA